MRVDTTTITYAKTSAATDVVRRAASVTLLLVVLAVSWSTGDGAVIDKDVTEQVQERERLDAVLPADPATTEHDVSTPLNKTRRSNAGVTPGEAQQEEWGLLARENVMNMRSDSIRCATPRPRVIKVQESHPHAFKRFVPSCVVLHRCEREAGCCDDEDHVCSPVHKQRVFMYFYVVALGAQDGVASVGVHGKVERLRFANHTRCACRKRRPPPTPKTQVVLSAGSGGTTVGVQQRTLMLMPALVVVASVAVLRRLVGAG